MHTQLLAQAHWADSIVWRATLAVPADRELLKKLWHIHTVQRAFLAAWRGEELVLTKFNDFPDASALRDYGRETHTLLSVYEPDDLSRGIVMPWAPSKEPVSLGDTILQVAMHSAYHRGQVNTRIRELGGEPPLVDYIAWHWFGKPEAEW